MKNNQNKIYCRLKNSCRFLIKYYKWTKTLLQQVIIVKKIKKDKVKRLWPLRLWGKAKLYKFKIYRIIKMENEIFSKLF